MHTVTISEVKRMFTTSNFRKGQGYFNQGRVKELAYDSVKEAWHASVIGTKRYQVMVQEEEFGFEFECNCPAFNSYNEECKHVVAVMLKIQETVSKEETVSSSQWLRARQQEVRRQQEELARQQEERRSVYVKQLTNQLISTFANHQQENISHENLKEKQPLIVEWICILRNAYTNRVLSLEMKVGHKRTYVVKNIVDFLHAISGRKQYPFTKTFSYDPTEYIFTDKDQDIIDLLQDAVKYEEMYRSLQSPYHQFGMSSDVRSITLSPIVADQILEKLMDRKIEFRNGGNTYHQLTFKQEELPFTYRLDKGSKEAFQLDLSSYGFVEYLDVYGYLVKGNDVYKLAPQQQNFVKEFKKLIQQAGTTVIPINDEQIEPLLSYVVPMMKELGKLEIADSISTKIRKHPLQAKMYVDWVDDLLHVKLEYHYGEHTIHPFDSKADQTENEPIVMRESEKEQRIMKTIESSPLKWNGQTLCLAGEEKMYEFLYGILPKLEEQVEIFLTNAVKSLILPIQYTPEILIDVDSSGNWLEVGFDLEGIEKKDIHKILLSAVERKKYYRLPSGAFVSLESEEFQTIQHLFEELNLKSTQLAQDFFRLPLYRGIQLEELVASDKGNKAKYGKSVRQLLNRLKNPEELDF